MKKTKWIPIVVAIAAVVIVLGIVLAARNSGRPPKLSEGEVNTTIAEEIQAEEFTEEVNTTIAEEIQAEEFTEEVNTTIAEVIQAEAFTGEELPLSQQYANAIIHAVSYEIVEANKAGKATVKFKYIDAMTMADMYDGPDDADAFYTYCIENIERGTAPVIEATLIVDYQTNEDGSIEIVDSIEFADVITGGAASEFLKLLEGE